MRLGVETHAFFVECPLGAFHGLAMRNLRARLLTAKAAYKTEAQVSLKLLRQARKSAGKGASPRISFPVTGWVKTRVRACSI